MKSRILLIVSTILLIAMIMQSHADGRATRNRDNTGAPGGQMGGNGNPITCQNCHSIGSFEVGLNLELLDSENNQVTAYVPNEVYTARVSFDLVSGNSPGGYGFQMVSLIDSDDSDINGWADSEHSDNVQLVFASSTGRVYAEHNNISTTNEFTAQWTAPAENSGDISFYVSGLGANANGADSGDHAPAPIRIIFPENNSTSISQVDSEIELNVYPNPTSEDLNISGSITNTTIEIYSHHGLIQSAQATNNQVTIPINELSAGVYFVVIKNANDQIIATRMIMKD